MDKRITDLEMVVKQLLATIEDLKKQKTDNERENAALKKRIGDLGQLVQTLQKSKPEEPETPSPIQPMTPTLGSEKLLPDFSFIIDSVGKTASRRSGDADRNRYLLREAEFAMQGYLYPNVRGDVFFSLEGCMTQKLQSRQVGTSVGAARPCQPVSRSPQRLARRHRPYRGCKFCVMHPAGARGG